MILRTTWAITFKRKFQSLFILFGSISQPQTHISTCLLDVCTRCSSKHRLTYLKSSSSSSLHTFDWIPLSWMTLIAGNRTFSGDPGLKGIFPIFTHGVLPHSALHRLQTKVIRCLPRGMFQGFSCPNSLQIWLHNRLPWIQQHHVTLQHYQRSLCSCLSSFKMPSLSPPTMPHPKCIPPLRLLPFIATPTESLLLTPTRHNF